MSPPEGIESLSRKELLALVLQLQRKLTELDARSKGRSPHPALGGAAMVLELVSRHSPDQLGLPFFLWSREAVGEPIKRRSGLELSKWTVGRHLKRWGLTPQKPARRAYEENPAAVMRWLVEEYPQVQRQAKEQGAEIHWGDEMWARTKGKLMRNLRSYLRSTQKCPDVVQRFFHGGPVRYAAA